MPFACTPNAATDSNNASTIVLMLEYNSSSNELFIKSYTKLETEMPETDFILLLANLYSTASNLVLTYL